VNSATVPQFHSSIVQKKEKTEMKKRKVTTLLCFCFFEPVKCGAIELRLCGTAALRNCGTN
jgi:hypothetical protein